MAEKRVSAGKSPNPTDEPSAARPASARWLVPGAALLVLFISYFTYFRNYSYPPFFFWDENYHVAHAQKYLNGVYFMEPHPPLGKMLIALGERIVGKQENNQFIGTDHAKTLPSGFSFAGYRLFPVMLAALTAVALYFVFLLITASPLQALFLSFLYLFDNALIVHLRGAMLEGPQLFFVAVSLLLALLLAKRSWSSRSFLLLAFMFGAAFAAACMVKINALVFSALVLPVLVRLWPSSKAMLRFGLSAAAGSLLVFVSVWQLHFSLGKRVNPELPDKGYYQASAEYKMILAEGSSGLLSNFPVMLRDSINFVGHYERGVPKLNLCNLNENGSPFFLWPFGGRSIDYRWERNGDKTRYLYLQINPAVWLLSLLGVLGAAALLFAAFTVGLPHSLKERWLMIALLAVWLAYMGVMARLDRVMYLYHYFLPLISGFVLLAALFKEIERIGPFSLGESSKNAIAACLAVPVLAAYAYFSPLTYYLPLRKSEVENRSWIPIWDLRCQDCPPVNGFATPTCDPKIKESPDLYLSGIKAERASQDWGDPKSNRTVEDQEIVVGEVKYARGFGVHANSSVRFRLKKLYSEFRASVGLPDYLKQKSSPGSVVFQVLTDGHIAWKSPLMKAGDAPIPVRVEARGVETLSLEVTDGGDNIDNDHACWINPELVK